MLERLLEFRSVLSALVAKSYETRDESGNKEQYKIPTLNFDEIEILVEALKPLANLTKQLSLRDASVADILPIYHIFMKQWSPSNLIEGDTIGKIRQKVTTGLDKRMKEMSSNG